MNIKNNTKFKDTDEKIQNTLLKILKTKNFDNITVKEVCSNAEINRSTFYAHYIDIYDLIEKTELTLRKKIVFLYNNTNISKDNFFTPEYISLFLQHIYDNRNFYRVCIKNRKSYPIEQGFEQLLDLIIKPHCEKIGLKSESEIIYCFVYFQAGFTTILKRWVDNDFKESPKELALIIHKCLSNGFKA